MPVVTPQGANIPNATFITECRRILRDEASYNQESLPTDGTTGTTAAASKPFRLQRAPVVSGSVTITVPGSATVVYDTAPTAGQVNVVTETGEMIFGTVPASGTLNVNYQFTTFSDAQILDALTEGMRDCYPALWQDAVDTSIITTALGFEYTLPVIISADPRVLVLNVEINPPSGIIRYDPVRDWEPVGTTIIAFRRQYQPGSTIRLHYNAPYQTLQDLETGVSHVPVYAAVARLLADQETMRSRQDSLPALTGEGATQPGQAMQTAAYWQEKFERELVRLARPLPIRKFAFREGGSAWGWSRTG